LFCPLPERIFPAEVQRILEKHQKPRDSEYGEVWQKERRRLDQINQQTQAEGPLLESSDEADDLDKQKGGVFIPITWLTKRKREFYSGSDPEWKEFVKLSNDKERVKAVKAKLCSAVCEEVSRKNGNAILITGKPLTVRMSWLDFHFPLSAPPEYERSGFLWTDNEIKWVTRKFEEWQARRLYRVLFPSALVSALHMMGSTLFTSHFSSLKGLWSSAGSEENKATTKVSSAPNSTTKMSNDSPRSALESGDKKRTAQQSFRLAATPAAYAELLRQIMPRPEPNTAIAAASTAFKINFLARWRASEYVMPRGSCIIKGEIGMQGPKGTCKMPVFAVYLPKEDVIAQISGLTPDVWPHRLSPLGKPKSDDKTKKP
jgi:hypothetical protein